MKTLKHKIQTNARDEMQNITHLVEQAISQWGMNDGFVNVFVPHTTAAVTINENADPDVVHDILMEINKIVPFNDGYLHMEGNSAAHIKSSLFGFSEQIIIENGRLVLGTWQGIYFCEFDGPRQRQVYVKITG